MSFDETNNYFEDQRELEQRFAQLAGGQADDNAVNYQQPPRRLVGNCIYDQQQSAAAAAMHHQMSGGGSGGAAASHWRPDMTMDPNPAAVAGASLQQDSVYHHHQYRQHSLGSRTQPLQPSQQPLQQRGAAVDLSPGGADYSPPMNSSFAGLGSSPLSMVEPINGSRAAAAAAGGGAAAFPVLAATQGGLQKSLCAVCGDRASGKHYGVYSCEGCKGFFKRTVRRELQYACREQKNCVVDKRQRNRCQYCRYMKCLNLGMRREAVQEERQKASEKVDVKVESTTEASNDGELNDMSIDRIIDAELAATGRSDTSEVLTEFADRADDDEGGVMCDAVDRQLLTLVEWARRIPHFIDLPVGDQIALLRSGWNELLIAAFAHQSMTTGDSITLARGLHVYRSNAHQAGIGAIFDRVLTELVSKMREMDMDIGELGCLRATVLFNPDAKGLSCPPHVEQLREKVYTSLEEYCRRNHPEETGRFAKLLLRLPALRSIGLKCADPLFVYRLLGDTPVESFLVDLLDYRRDGSGPQRRRSSYTEA